MAEYIEREAVLAAFSDKDCPWSDFEDAWEIVENYPAADVVEVVRCKDCKRCNGFTEPDDIQPNEVGICRINMMAVKPDGFCYWGERKGK